MNCFVIMPFSDDFDDVYGAIKQSVESAVVNKDGRCIRLDEAKPAGRITDRLLRELESATICVADITGAKPNVMWELGFVMALGKPVVVITQRMDDLPFDIRDMQTIEYQRARLSTTLAAPIKRVILDTLANENSEKSLLEKDGRKSETIGVLLNEIGELKKIVSEVVGTWKTLESGTRAVVSKTELQGMIGHWFNTESGSHAYTKVVHGELVTPYCFMGNEDISGIYFGWRRTGDYWFTRYKWLTGEISGFSFLKRNSANSMVGAWWSSEHEPTQSESPPKYEGVPAEWVRLKDDNVPNWAQKAFNEIEAEGLASYLAKNHA